MFILLGRSLTAIVLAVAALACAQPTMAAQPNQFAPSYDFLVARLDEMPSAMEAAALSDAADARARQARAIPNPSVAWEMENIYGSGPYKGVGNADITASISQPLELFGQRSARIGAARAQANAIGLRSEQLRWLAAGRLARVYAEAEAAGRRYDLAAEALSLTEEDTRAVGLLVKEGREATLRGVQAESEAEAARETHAGGVGDRHCRLIRHTQGLTLDARRESWRLGKGVAAVAARVGQGVVEGPASGPGRGGQGARAG